MSVMPRSRERGCGHAEPLPHPCRSTFEAAAASATEASRTSFTGARPADRPRRPPASYRNASKSDFELTCGQLRRGDLEWLSFKSDRPDGLEVEFVTASGRTQASVTADVRAVSDQDLISVRTLKRYLTQR